jgi:hypothetical protein
MQSRDAQEIRRAKNWPLLLWHCRIAFLAEHVDEETVGARNAVRQLTKK